VEAVAVETEDAPRAKAAPEQPAAPSQSEVPAQEDTVLARVRARQATSAEPKLERVVVSPDQTGSADAGGGEEPTVRRGWWQRRLGG